MVSRSGDSYIRLKLHLIFFFNFRGKEKKSAPICWFSLQMPAQAPNQEPQTPMQVAGTQLIAPILRPTRICINGKFKSGDRVRNRT